jgi:hypothetical protein
MGDLGYPQNVDEMVEDLKADPSVSSKWVRFKDQLLIGSRSDDGTLYAWDCRVKDERSAPGGGR